MAIEIDNDNDEIRIDGYEYANAKVSVKTYGVSSENSQTGNSADLRLTGNDSSTDNVTFTGGANVTVVRTDANKITISASANDTNTTYGISAEANATPNTADLRLTGSDSTTDNLTLVGGTNVTVVKNNANTITLSSLNTNTTYGVSSENSQTLNSADLRLTGSDSTTDNLTFTGGTAINVVSTDANKITISNGGVTQAVAGTGISVSAGTGSVTVGNTGVTSINGAGGAQFVYNTITDGVTPTSPSNGNTTLTLSGSNGVKVTTSANTATVSMTETSKILIGPTPTTIPVSPSQPNTFFEVQNMSANSAVEIRGIILLKFSGAGQSNTINVTLATSGTFTHAGVDLQIGAQNAEITSSAPGFATTALNDSNVHALWFSGVIVNGGTTATPSININNNSGVNTLDILAKSFIKYNVIQ